MLPVAMLVRIGAVVGVVAILGLAYWSWSSRGAEIDRLERESAVKTVQLNVMQQTLDENRAAFEDERKRFKTTLDELQAATRTAETRANHLNQIRRDTRDAEDGPVAPVLARTLDGLREARAGNQAGDEGAGDPPGSPATTD